MKATEGKTITSTETTQKTKTTQEGGTQKQVASKPAIPRQDLAFRAAKGADAAQQAAKTQAAEPRTTKGSAGVSSAQATLTVKHGIKDPVKDQVVKTADQQHAPRAVAAQGHDMGDNLRDAVQKAKFDAAVEAAVQKRLTELEKQRAATADPPKAPSAVSKAAHRPVKSHGAVPFSPRQEAAARHEAERQDRLLRERLAAGKLAQIAAAERKLQAQKEEAKLAEVRAREEKASAEREAMKAKAKAACEAAAAKPRVLSPSAIATDVEHSQPRWKGKGQGRVSDLRERQPETGSDARMDTDEPFDDEACVASMLEDVTPPPEINPATDDMTDISMHDAPETDDEEQSLDHDDSDSSFDDGNASLASADYDHDDEDEDEGEDYELAQDLSYLAPDEARPVCRKRKRRVREPAMALYVAKVIDTADNAFDISSSIADVDETILDEIKKCLSRDYRLEAPEDALDDDDRCPEARRAVALASRLMRRYRLDRAEVLPHQTPEQQRAESGQSLVQIERRDGNISKDVKRNVYLGSLMRAIEKFFDVDSSFNFVHRLLDVRGKGLRIRFIGIASNTVAAALAFERTHDLIVNEARQYKGQVGRNNFCMGFCQGLQKKADEERKAQELEAKEADARALALRLQEEEAEREARLHRLARSVSSIVIPTVAAPPPPPAPTVEDAPEVDSDDHDDDNDMRTFLNDRSSAPATRHYSSHSIAQNNTPNSSSTRGTQNSRQQQARTTNTKTTSEDARPVVSSKQASEYMALVLASSF